MISSFNWGFKSLKYALYPDTRTIRFGWRLGLSIASIIFNRAVGPLLSIPLTGRLQTQNFNPFVFHGVI